MKYTNRWIDLLLLVLLVLPFFVISAPASSNGGTTYLQTYANAATGSDSYDGSSRTFTGGVTGPKKTINAAINVTKNFGTIYVAAGTYTECITMSNGRSLVGSGALTTIIDANGTGCTVTVTSTSNCIIMNVTITGGAPYGSYCGGGVYVDNSVQAFFDDCAIVDNYKGSGSSPLPGRGGGVCNNEGRVYLTRCTISGNTANYQGGGLANICTTPGSEYGKMELTNCTVSGNSITQINGAGGGLYTDVYADTTLLNVTIADNHAAGPNSVGGGFSNSAISSMYLKNCIVANNTATMSQYNNGYNGLGSGVNSQGNNLSSDNSCYFGQASDQVNTNPLLGPLQNNGGPTSTMAITTASPAYNRGDRGVAPDTDQRRVDRPTGAFCAIGAYEPPADIKTASTSTAIGTVNFTINSGSINGLTSISTANSRCAPSGYSFPYGFFSFNISSLTTGASVQVTIRVPNPLPSNVKYYKCINGAVVDCSPFMTRPDPYTIILTLTDGGRGDADGIANGIIVDPGGPAFPLNTNPTSHQSSLPAAPQAPVSLSNITVKSASLSATKVSPGTPVTVTANVANTGTGNGASNIKVYVNGNEESSQGVTVTSGTSTPVTFIVSRNERGTYSVYVGGTQAGSFTVDEFADANTILFISGALVFFALVIGVIYMTRRRAY